MDILVIEDDPMTLKMVEFLLKGEGYNVTKAESIREAETILKKSTPWLIIVDKGLPDGNGIEFSKKLNETEPDIPVILLTGEGRLPYKLEGLESADDYIVKPFEPGEFIARVKAVLRRVERVPRELVQSHLKVGDVELAMRELKVTLPHRKSVILTPTEMKILECLMAHAGKVVTRDSIAEKALGYEYEGESNAIDVYIRRLRTKIEPDPAQPIYIETVKGSGYRFRKVQNGELVK
ncbi:MAG: response regulator transcription factor [Chloroflexi bacterium]|uniref:Response regulator transcription factor n=1 Tax=Candidatus Chlorohelix allophototropha TaxID=3003348 RepID=A0A8T7M7U1_9CHLR|nr:response regulator transcription factor [Chloroflexota bacterium]WJW68082.1 response regulator transcription factor [Chloroflexota bacterium L227-S17]